ncbi:MAG: HhH-GPD family protein [Syntrophorhabdaceae bacterium]
MTIEDPGFSAVSISQFRETLAQFYARHRRDFSWRENITPYRIIVSEIMLQQTGVERAISKYDRFLSRFPGFEDLARASVKDVLEEWQGLGYNKRALALKKLSHNILECYSGIVPDNPGELERLPGIGKATAGAICAFAFNKPVIFIETNIRRVFIHHFFGDRLEISDREIRPLIEKSIDRVNPRDWYYALMDYGTYIVKLTGNPNRKSAHYSKQSTFQNSDRQIRGELLRFFLQYGRSGLPDIIEGTGHEGDRLTRILRSMIKDGLVTGMDETYDISR